MARLPLYDEFSAPEEARPSLLAAQKNAGYLSNLLALLAGAPAALEAYQTLSQINAKSGLTLAEREVVQLAAATRHGCTFCVAGHTALARNKARMAEPDIQALRDQVELPTSKLAALATFTRAVIEARGRVSDEQLEALRTAGYTSANALEVVLGVGLATICNFANNLGQTELNPEMSGYRWERP
jgi:uncharacterized peroxidase-related enzyme